ncbi:MAG: hypothetical protein G01um10143_472 [Parcubacteria group bacterium Gr01-1014_3]|nr:MAG: hypothetical protein G01um10143_472 [Parcubacteria group bacterium Gr01-1014_3]
MALKGDEVAYLIADLRKQREELALQDFHYKIGWNEADLYDLFKQFEDTIMQVAYSELFTLTPGRLPFLVVFPPSSAANEDKLKERLAMLGFSATMNQIQVKLSQIEDIEKEGSYPYIIFDVDPGYLMKDTRYSAVVLQQMKPVRRRLTFFEAVSMAPKIKVNFQIVITGARYIDEDTSPAIDFAMSKAAPIINHFDLNNTSARIGIPSCVEPEVYKSKTAVY